MNRTAYNTITAIDVDLVLPAGNRERLIHLVADYAEIRPTDLDIHEALALLGLRGEDYTVLPPASDDLPDDTVADLALFSSHEPTQPWITQLIHEHPDLFLTHDDVRAGNPYIAGTPARVRLSAAVHSSQIRDDVELAGSVPFIVYQDNATSHQTILLVRIDAVHTPGDTHLTVERSVITEMCDPETWYHPILAEHGD